MIFIDVVFYSEITLILDLGMVRKGEKGRGDRGRIVDDGLRIRGDSREESGELVEG